MTNFDQPTLDPLPPLPMVVGEPLHLDLPRRLASGLTWWLFFEDDSVKAGYEGFYGPGIMDSNFTPDTAGWDRFKIIAARPGTFVGVAQLYSTASRVPVESEPVTLNVELGDD